MMPADPTDKLPVPGPWQAAVRAAVADLAGRLGIAPAAIAVTRVDEGAGAAGAALSVWLMAAGRTWRYVADPAFATAERDGASPAG